MKKTINRFLNRYVFSEELPLEHKIFNLVLLFGIVAEIVALIARIIEKVSLQAIIAVAVMIMVTAVAFLLCTRLRLYKWAIPVALVFVCNILFPVIFFTNGGAYSGVASFFVLCIILNFFLLRGKLLVVMIFVQIAVVVSCFVTGKYNPGLIIPFETDFARYLDIIHAIMIAGFLSGFLVKFQIRIYEKEKEKAEAATRAKADFLANISHEIRTPLNAIIGLGGLELNKKLPTDTLVNLEKMQNSGMSLLSIINDLLDISKIESGRFDLIPVEYQIASFINDTVQLNMVRIGSKPIIFRLDIDEELPKVLTGDELRFRQILNNLLSNAFKYTKEGQVLLKMRSEAIHPEGIKKDSGGEPRPAGSAEDSGKINIVCTIEDTGMGIREEDIGKLFSAYNQVDVRSNRHIEGTGLGLSICKNLVELMGGTVTVKSTYGKGTAFNVVIPQIVTDPAPIGKEIAENLAKFRFNAGKRERRRAMRNPIPYGKILVVDDVPTNLDVAKGMMLPYGLTVDCASSGVEAIRIIKEETVKYDLVFMDHMMPGMDGIEAVRIIRNEINSDYARSICIIALTANAIIGNDKMFIENGFNDFLSKPIDMLKLDVILQKWVRDKEKETSAEWAPVVEGLRQEEIDLSREAKDKATIKEPSNITPRGSPIPGIDYEEGIKRMGNKEASFIRILSSFAAGMPTLLDKIRHFDTCIIDDYRITIHGIKGSSYGICANEIARQAEALEMAAKNGDVETILAKNDGFILHMEKLIGEIAKYVTSL